MASLAGRHALVTGGGSGIGAAIARALAAEGAAVSAAGRRREPLEALAVALPHAAAIVADVTQADDCRRMVEEARAALGPIDIVVANAGAAESTPFAAMGLDHWHRMIAVNLTGSFLTVQAALSDVARSEPNRKSSGRVVFVASTAGLKGYPYVAAYCAAKHGVVGLARALAAELASRGVTVNAVCPGYTETPLLESAVANIVAKTGRDASAARGALAFGNPLRRLIMPEEVAATVVWLCQSSSGAITGQAISVSGGET